MAPETECYTSVLQGPTLSAVFRSAEHLSNVTRLEWCSSCESPCNKCHNWIRVEHFISLLQCPSNTRGKKWISNRPKNSLTDDSILKRLFLFSENGNRHIHTGVCEHCMCVHDAITLLLVRGRAACSSCS